MEIEIRWVVVFDVTAGIWGGERLSVERQEEMAFAPNPSGPCASVHVVCVSICVLMSVCVSLNICICLLLVYVFSTISVSMDGEKNLSEGHPVFFRARDEGREVGRG